MNIRFVIWGAGERGRNRIFPHIEKWTDAFIDIDERKQGMLYADKPIISFERYILEYAEDYIVISPMQEDEIVSFLEGKGITRFFRLTECPGDFQGPNPNHDLKDYVNKCKNKSESISVYGMELFSLLVSEWIVENSYIKVNFIIPEFYSKTRASELRKDFCDLTVINKSQASELIFNTVHDYNELSVLNKDASIVDLFDCSDRIEKYYSPSIEQIHDIYKKRRCFIVATGPSLTPNDLDILFENHEICLSMNSIYKIFSKTKWRPDYYIANDYRCLRDERNEIERIEAKYLFIADDTYPHYWDYEHKNNIIKNHVVYECSEHRKMKFSEDVSRKCYYGVTVTYECIQFAAYMGFSDIYLLGVDSTCLSPDRRNGSYGHFYDEEKLEAVGYTDYVKKAFMSAKEYADSHDMHIYNATRGGYLEIFDRVSFDDLFNQEA